MQLLSSSSLAKTVWSFCLRWTTFSFSFSHFSAHVFLIRLDLVGTSFVFHLFCADLKTKLSVPNNKFMELVCWVRFKVCCHYDRPLHGGGGDDDVDADDKCDDVALSVS